MIRERLQDKWEVISGKPGDFSFENRMFNSVCAITFLMVFLLMLFNVVMSLFMEAFITMAVLVIDIYVYYLSRYRRKYKVGIYIYAISSYIALFFVYYYNAGITGPTLFFFFLTFQVIATVTPKKQHLVWALIHVLFAGLLCLSEFLYPDLIERPYINRGTHFADVVFSFMMALFFVYLITSYLRNNLDRIRRRSLERAEEIEAHLHEIEQQNARLKEISWLQSHKVRSQVATILGLSQFVNQSSVEDPDLNRVIGGIKEAAKELDDVIKEINRLTNNTDINK